MLKHHLCQEEDYQTGAVVTAAASAANAGATIDRHRSPPPPFAINMTESTSPLSSPHADSTQSSQSVSICNSPQQQQQQQQQQTTAFNETATAPSAVSPHAQVDDVVTIKHKHHFIPEPDESDTASFYQQQQHHYDQQHHHDNSNSNDDETAVDSASVINDNDNIEERQEAARTLPSPARSMTPAPLQSTDMSDGVHIKMEIDEDDDDHHANDDSIGNDADDEADNNGAMDASHDIAMAASASAISPSASLMPKLRLNINLASDPALQPHARDIQQTAYAAANNESAGMLHVSTDRHESPHADVVNDGNRCRSQTPDSPGLPHQQHHQHHQHHQLSAHPHQQQSPVGLAASASVLLNELTREIPAIQSESPATIQTANSTNAVMPTARHHGPTMFVCEPCGIKYSSMSTLEAHQTYYCMQSGKKTVPPGGAGSSAGTGSGTNNNTDDATVSGGAKKSDALTAADATGGTAASKPPGRVTKLYACSHCTYSADKKVSLNRHMRMHQASPPVTAASLNPPVQTNNVPLSVAGQSNPLNGDGTLVAHATVDALLAAAAAAAAATAGQPGQLQQQQQQQQQQQPIDRYCSDCDIRFSSTKTFRAHKQHYCSGRQRDVGGGAVAAGSAARGAQSAASNSTSTAAQVVNTAKSRSQSPQETSTSPPSAVPSAPQPYLALPTNPIIIIPYSLIRAASILPGPLTTLSPNVLNPEQSCYVFKNGTLHPIAQAHIMPTAIVPTALTVAAAAGGSGSGAGGAIDASIITSHNMHSPNQQQQQRAGTPSNSQTTTETHARQSGSRKREHFNRPAPTTPLDLSVQRLADFAAPGNNNAAHRDRSGSFSSNQSDDGSAGNAAAAMHMHMMDNLLILEGKENMSSNASTPEQIVCAPSLPGSPPESPSPPKNLQHHQQHQQQQQQHHQQRQPNSVQAQQQQQLQQQQQQQQLQLLQQQAAAAATGNPSAMLSPAAFAQSLMLRQLPAELAANFELALRLQQAGIAVDAVVPTTQQHQAPPPLAPLAQQPSVRGNTPTTAPTAATLNALNNKTTSSSSSSASAPQIFVKQGVSKCIECNIVFCKHENFIAHKKHYCSARLTDAEVGQTPASAAQLPPTSVTTKTGSAATAQQSAVADGSQRSSPSTSPTSAQAPQLAPAPTSSVGPALAYQQLICAACGTKFTSLDNLGAHQMYYCSKRIEQQQLQQKQQQQQQQLQQQLAQAQSKCAKCKMQHDPNLPCTQQQSQLQHANIDHLAVAAAVAGANATQFKCPMCDNIASTAAESRRHLETHASIKAFRCTICRYRGNTLRGMRTHIRMHFEKNAKDFNEEHFIACILENESGQEVEAGHSVGIVQTDNSGNNTIGPQQQVAQQAAAVVSSAEPPALVALYSCDKCNYSSSFKGNVVRHNKLVHSGTNQAQREAPQQQQHQQQHASQQHQHQQLLMHQHMGEGGESLVIVKAPASQSHPLQHQSTSNTHSSQFGSVIHIKTEPYDPASSAAVATAGTAQPSGPVAQAPQMPTADAPHPDYEAEPPAFKRIKREHLHSGNIIDSVGAGCHIDDGSLNVIAQAAQPPPAVASAVAPPAEAATVDPPNYCHICDIRFNYVNTFLAHKQFYCKAATAKPPPLISDTEVAAPVATDAITTPTTTPKASPTDAVSPQPAGM